MVQQSADPLAMASVEAGVAVHAAKGAGDKAAENGICQARAAPVLLVNCWWESGKSWLTGQGLYAGLPQ